ncbi:MAG: hypothetical protein DRJ03_10895 [Chloroflexi bacterium]|nr:MAG: hypothetical protein DRJ03_10895 [Chloroflexota bacterium]
MRLLLAALILCVSATVHAEEEDPVTSMRRLPVVESTDIEGLPHKCLGHAEWKTVLLIAQDYQGLYMWRLKIEGVLAAHEDIIASYELRLTGYESMLDLKDADIEYYKVRLTETESLVKSNRFADRVEKYLLWGVILVETIVIGVMGVRLVVSAD